MQPSTAADRPTAAGRLTVDDLRQRFTTLTHLMYDTRVPLHVLERDVYPHLAPNIEFVDPWVHTRGRRIFEVGLRGFHCTFLFDFDIFQIDVALSPDGNGGRAMVDGVMNLRSLIVYTYPLRTVLVYDFVLTDGGTRFLITRQEEMWSLGDMLQNLPLGLGRAYDLWRRASGLLIAGGFWLSCAIVTRLRPSVVTGPRPRTSPSPGPAERGNERACARRSASP